MTDLADGLLEHAGALLALDTRRPKQVTLRRAVSAAYYAVFHRLIARSTERLAGSGSSAEVVRHTTARWYQHARMAGTAALFAHPISQAKKQTLRALLVDELTQPAVSRVPLALTDLAAAFVELQDARHSADYDLSAWYSRADARAHWERAKAALAAESALQSEPLYGLFLLMLLTGDSVVTAR